MARIGVLTGGEDCPGINSVIRGIVLRAWRRHAGQIVGFVDGWEGLTHGNSMELDWRRVRDIAGLGGTILGIARMSVDDVADGAARARATVRKLGLDALVVIGGRETLAAATLLADAGIPILAIPTGIENGMSETDRCLGFDTAVEIATSALDRIKTAGESRHRCMIAEVVGLNSGWVALDAGTATGAHAILVPEFTVPTVDIATWVETAAGRGRSPLIVVSEGFASPSTSAGSVSVAQTLAAELAESTAMETTWTPLGLLQRGASPTASDRVLGTRLGFAAIDAVSAGARDQVATLRHGEIVLQPLSAIGASRRTISRGQYDRAQEHFG